MKLLRSLSPNFARRRRLRAERRRDATAARTGAPAAREDRRRPAADPGGRPPLPLDWL